MPYFAATIAVKDFPFIKPFNSGSITDELYCANISAPAVVTHFLSFSYPLLVFLFTFLRWRIIDSTGASIPPIKSFKRLFIILVETPLEKFIENS